ncbi:MAG: carbamoyltransferase HypF [Frankiales bacterium]|nr:carbamoyltransferase HypF [Frankiales bacterium]
MDDLKGGAPVRTRAHVTGIVQGVGFRPFVWRKAVGLGLAGFVRNDTAGVVLEVEGAPAAVTALLAALHTDAPPLARVDQVRSREVALTGEAGFSVQFSDSTGPRDVLVSPDAATCDACLAEVRDPVDRRFGHVFATCTHCGPRYTIVRDVPYDRQRTTMAGFPLCPSCQAEYDDPGDRRFHAQPLCCPACGPRLALLDADGQPVEGDALGGAADLLRAGGVLAVKGLGGFHLAVLAADEAAVALLRRRKHREDRPFALMVADLPGIRTLCDVDPGEEQLLVARARPILLLRRRIGAAVAPSVAPGQRALGVMLPYTALHHRLLAEVGGPLVMTSGNRSDEPIAYEDGDALQRLSGVADAWLTHDRPIRTRVDDSVVRAVRGRVVPIRRSRGYVPDPLTLPLEARRTVLGCGASLKNTFCLARGRHAFVSHHIGDLDDYSTYGSYLDGIDHLRRLFDLQPVLVAHDLHPDYPSTRYAAELPDVERVAVQHHHAHVAACLVDNGVRGPVIGVALDGSGLGEDGTLWGGEFLLADLVTATRVAHLQPVPLPGGDAATRQPWRMAASYLDAAYGADVPALEVRIRQGRRWDHVLSAAAAGLNAPLSSSAGRLFDAVAAVLGLRDAVTYEGQAAVELEQCADEGETGSYPVRVQGGPILEVPGAELVRAVVQDRLAGASVPIVAARFHNAMADVVIDVCSRLRGAHGLDVVALSGGVFQNALLLGRCLDGLQGAGFEVLTHRQVPCNDGGISLGQVAVAAARDGSAC